MKRSMTFLAFELFVSLVLFSLSPLRAYSDLIVTGVGAGRGVAAASTGGAGSFDSTILLGSYVKSVGSPGLSPAGEVYTTANQSSYAPNTTGPTMSGGGAVTATTTATGDTGFSVLADSFFDVFFQVSVDELYYFDAAVNWNGDFPPYSDFARVTLSDFTNSVDLLEVLRTSGTQGSQSITGTVFLYAGTTYRMFGEAKIEGGWATAGFSTASADWSFLLIVPEPGGLTLFALGALGLTVYARRCRSRTASSHAGNCT